MRKLILTITIILVSQQLWAQIPVWNPYIDFGTFGASEGESLEANKTESAKKKNSLEWAKIEITTLAEKASMSRLGTPVRWINFDDYKHVCDFYKSPGKKRMCNARKDYLQTAYETVLDLLSIRTHNEIRNGVVDQIWERYGSICNLIVKDLDRMREKAEDESQLNFFNLYR